VADLTTVDAPDAGESAWPGDLRVLFICHSKAVGGSELYCEELATRMARRANVRVICQPDGAMDDWARRIHAAGVTVARTDPSTPAGFAALRRAIRWASVVHLTLANRVGGYQVLVVLACRLERRPLICTHQLARETDDLPFGPLGRRFRTLALRTVYRRADRHIAVSAEGLGLLSTRVGLDPQRTVEINNGVDLARFHPLLGEERARLRRSMAGDAAERLVISCTVARLSAQKGLEVLVEAAGRLREKAGLPAICFVVVGDGELRDQLLQQVAELGLEDTVRLVGARPPDEIPGWLAAADMFVLPSRYEGMSIAVMEAMASGLPVVATEVSGTAELIPDPDHGLVVPVGDAGALTAAIEELLTDPELRRRIGERGALRVQRFSWESVFARTARLLEETAAAR
jgi:glycosyltransferase involved in cell wall biosynthesis